MAEYLQRWEEKPRPKSPPLKNVVFRTMSDAEWQAMQSGERSGGFWTSDPTEYGRHAFGSWGKKDATDVFVAATFDPQDGKIYAGLVRTPEQAAVAHFNSRKSKSLDDVIAAYKWDGQKLSRIFATAKSYPAPHFGRPGEVGGSSPRLDTPGAKLTYNEAQTDDDFKITAPDGSHVIGYYRNADFPGEYGSPTRGELYYVNSKNPKQGMGTSLSLDALRVMASHGCKTVNLSVTSQTGKALRDKLRREGYISPEPLRVSESGKEEYKILITQKSYPDPHFGRPGKKGGSRKRPLGANAWEETKPLERPPRGPLFHGTPLMNINQILKEGVSPEVQRIWGEEQLAGERGRSVFFTEDKESAAFWGKRSYETLIQRMGGKLNPDKLRMAVVEFEVPPGVPVKQDELIEDSAYRLVGKIKPEWIKGYTVVRIHKPGEPRAEAPPFTDERGNRDILFDYVPLETHRIVDGKDMRIKAEGRIFYIPIWYIDDTAEKEQGRAPKGGVIGVNGFFYEGGQFLPSSANTIPGQWRIDGKTVKAKRFEIEPRKWELQPTPGATPLYTKIFLYVKPNKDGTWRIWENVLEGKITLNNGEVLTPDTELSQGYTLRELVELYNRGARWLDKPAAKSYPDPHIGRPGEKGGSRKRPAGVIYYRGTSKQVADKVFAEGIERGGSWHGRPPSVYVTKKKEDAFTYARLLGMMDPNATDFGIVEVQIPKSVKLLKDDFDTFAESYRMERDVPAEWVKKIEVYDTGILQYERTRKAEPTDYITVYVLIAILPEKTSKSYPAPHKGLPGHHGGSSPRGTVRLVGEDSDETILEVPAEVTERYPALTTEKVKELFEIPGLNTEISVWMDKKSGVVFLSGIWTDEEGRKKATVNESLRGDLVKLDYGRVSADLQAKGMAFAFLKNHLQRLAECGVKEATLEANISIGSYAWAKEGFDFTTDAYRAEHRAFFGQFVDDLVFNRKIDYGQANALKEAIGKCRTAKDFAELALPGVYLSAKEWGCKNPEVPADMKMDFGKACMLTNHRGWEGRKTIAPAAKSYPDPHYGRPGEVGGSRPRGDVSGELDASLRDYAKKSVGTLKERCVLIDRASGKVLADFEQELEEENFEHKQKPGSGFSSLDMVDEEGKPRAEGTILGIHTHPVDHTFSDGDWRIFAGRQGYGEMRVYSPGSEYRLEKTAAFHAMPWQQRTPAKINESYNRIMGEVEQSLAGRGLSEEEWIKRDLHETTARMADEFHIKYTVLPYAKKFEVLLAKSYPAPHVGLPGRWGGSSPRGTTVVTEPPVVKVYGSGALSAEEIQRMKGEVALWPNDNARWVATDALSGYAGEVRTVGKCQLVTVEYGGELKGVASYLLGLRQAEGKTAYVLDIATKENGFGARLMEKIISQAVAKNLPVRLYALKSAVPFYEWIGFEAEFPSETGAKTMSLSVKAGKEFLRKYHAE